MPALASLIGPLKGKSLFQSLKSKKKIIFNSLWVILDKIIRMVGGLFVGIWFARYLGPYNFGAWNYAYSLVSLAIPFVNLGLNNILLTDLVKSADKGKVLFTGFIIKIFSGSLVAFLLYLYSFSLRDEQLTRSLLIILSFQCIFQATDVFDLFYQARMESRNSVVAKTSAYLLMNVLKIIALVYGFSLLFFALLTLMEVVVSAIILLYFYFNVSHQRLSDWKVDFSLIRDLLRRSWPFIVSELLITLYTRLDQVMIKNMVGNAELGKYSAAVRMSEIWYFIGSAISISVYPAILKLREKSEADFMNGFQKLFNLLTTISVSLSLLIMVFSGWITGVLYGDKFAGIGSILSIHIWTGVFVYLGVGCSNWFIVKDLQKYMIWRTAIGAAVNACLNIMLIPKYGSLGAAVATLIAQAFASVIANAFSSKTREIFWLQVKSFVVIFRPSLKNYI
ncbi:flippase [Paraflavisolibacter sp. H34]|uniref:flippase n=1 Tax=Huijunlia imazamoxiresistens TaxID=3127457 RepID=UPI00301A9AC6